MSVRTDVLLWAQRVIARRGSAPHVLLEISEKSTPEQVQEAFHKIARTSHPDLHRHGLDADELEMVTSAYAAVAGAYQQMRSAVMQTTRLRAIKPDDLNKLGATGDTRSVTPDSRSVTPPDSRPVTPAGGSRPVTPPGGARAPAVATPPAGTRSPATPFGGIRNPAVATPASDSRTAQRPGSEPRAPMTTPARAHPRAGTGSDPPANEAKPARAYPRPGTGSDPPSSRVGRSYPRAGTGSDPPGNAPKPASVSATGSSPPGAIPTPAIPVAPSGAAPAQNAAQAMSSKALLYYRKAELCLKRGDLKGAILQLKLACAADPTSSFLRTALAEVETEVRKNP